MTIGLIDPALLLPRAPELVESELAQILAASKKFNIRILPFSDYWPDLWTELGRPLEASLPPEQRRAVQQLRQRGEHYSNEVPWAGQTCPGSVWKDGFEQLFGNINGHSWTDRMAQSVLRAVAQGESVVMFTRLQKGRNLAIHSAGGTTLLEITRWVLHVQSQTHGRLQILCVSHPRNIIERWTARYDARLPSDQDGAGYPFCVPERWWQAATVTWGTVQSKPCWIDRCGNGWARPNITDGKGYHWDVFIKDQNVADKIGLDQLNIVQHGAPEKEGRVGWIHHVPTVKQGKIDQTRAGWACC